MSMQDGRANQVQKRSCTESSTTSFACKFNASDMFPLFLEGGNVGLGKVAEQGCVQDNDAWVVGLGDARLGRFNIGSPCA